ncbi:maleylpyruvate isomerase family mycothiol-dependent enzyme [Cryobacterium tepidiphilum]|uniref:Maleylpyruvate isomerase family mycothiol-dependent enzyme n=1 Tax=Cryobacterium tepidiphilum TaxID=2486026 RepID=A0A3M8LDZ7_9MICO|nr:maleylpyruvate isomerase family mycothiol-dependent enzyme [Cryobacterium tepidiphilum]RNE63701.1 maleylpyruvate isomerase family mycothiol-dependent enzyme [Cryobacterium tepidiphilum]
MPDFTRYLPLGLTPKRDETGVSPRWNEQMASILLSLADLLENAASDAWDEPSECEGWRVRDAVGHIVWRVGTPSRELVASATRAWVHNGLRVNRAIDAASKVAAEAEPAELLARLRAIAADKAAGRGRTGVSELTEVVVHGFDITHPLGLALNVSDTASGAVALRQALLAPLGVRAVLRRRSLVATDAGWSVGRGAPLRGTAEEHILFLFGRRGPAGRDGTSATAGSA